MDNLLIRGEDHFSRGEFEEAKECFALLLEKDPGCKEGWNNLGVMAYQEGDLKRAFQSFTRALGVDPFYREAFVNLHQVVKRTGAMAGMAPLAEEFARHYPEDETLAGLLGEIRSARAKTEVESRRTLAKADPVVPGKPGGAGRGLKVLQGTMEIANQMNTYVSGLRGRGGVAKSVCYYPNYLGYDADYVLDVNAFKDVQEANRATRELASRMIPGYDVFHFHYGTSLTLDRSDLRILKEAGKRVFMNYWGSEVRTHDTAVRINPYIRVKFRADEDAIRRNLEYTGRYVSHCIVADHELFEYVKDYFARVHFIPQAIDLSAYPIEAEGPKNRRPIVTHAPTDPATKGSPYIMAAVEELKEAYDFEFILVQNLSHEEAKKIYRKSDIIIDSILEGAYGLFALETMAMGKPVIGWICDYMKERYPADLPIFPANPTTVKSALEALLKDKEKREDAGTRGRRYVEKYHEAGAVAGQLMDLYRSVETERSPRAASGAGRPPSPVRKAG